MASCNIGITFHFQRIYRAKHKENVSGMDAKMNEKMEIGKWENYSAWHMASKNASIFDVI